MGKIEVLDEKFWTYRWVGPRYYDHPDGEDLFGKLRFTSTIAAVVGLITGGTSAFVIPNPPTTFKGRVFQTARVLVPCLGVSFIFTTTTYFLTVIRKKDEEINYGISGFLAGASLAATTPRPHLGLLGAIVCSACGYIKKYHQLRGWLVLPPYRQKNFNPYITSRVGTYFIEERKGNWTKDPVN